MEIDPDTTGPGGRAAVIRVVGRMGPLTAADAATRLGVTPAAVRRHLDALVASGLARPHEPSGVGVRGRGRPARSFVLTELGRSAFDGGAAAGVTGDGAAPGSAEDLAVDALDFIARTHGEQAVVRFAHQRAKAMESRFAARVAAAGPDPGRRSRALAEALDAEGYAATARPVVTGTQVCQGRCPVHRIAAAHPELCEAEAAAFGRLVGVPVQRLATLAGGAHVCTTHVGRLVPVGAAAAPRALRPAPGATRTTTIRTTTTRTTAPTSTPTSTQRRPVSTGAGEDHR